MFLGFFVIVLRCLLKKGPFESPDDDRLLVFQPQTLCASGDWDTLHSRTLDQGGPYRFYPRFIHYVLEMGGRWKTEFERRSKSCAFLTTIGEESQ